MKIAAIAGLSSVLVLGALTACGDDDDNGSNGGTGGGDASAGTGGGGGSGGGTAGSGGSGGGTAGSGGSGGGSGGSGGGTAGTGGSTGDAGDAAASVSFGGGVVEYAQGDLGSEAPLEGVEVCVVDSDGTNVTPENCDTSDATGTYSLPGLEPGARVILLFTKDGYASQAVALAVPTMDTANAIVVRMATAVADGGAGTGPMIGIDPSVVLDPANGLMNVFAVQAAASPDAGSAAPGFDWTTGVSFAITPDSGDGPFYINTDETWASGATSTTGAWGAWFVNLPPGEFSVSASHATMNCVPAGGRFGWPETDGTATAPVIAGVNTQSIGFFCSEPPGDAGADGG